MEIEYAEVDRERTPLGEVVLRRFRADTGEEGFEILLDGAFLMATHGSHSERLMARLAWERLPQGRRTGIDVLVGGLGAGHTLRAVLDLAGTRRVTVVEIGQRVVDWNRGPLAPFNGRAVEDPRVEVVVGDVRQVLGERPGSFDLVLLDVDNGPGWLAAPGNAALYDGAGLAVCRAALRPAGVLAVWAPARNPALERGLEGTCGWWDAVDTSPEGRRQGEPGMVVYVAG